MTAAPADATTAAPSPEECDHPAPTVGVMAHEFSPYPGAIGPEGKRRTTTYYGPIIGGLPIQAWHCEVCGLLRLTFYDGRREERRLWPGPQPGLIAEPMAGEVAPEHHFGMQARVSGLTAPPELIATLVPVTEGPGFSLPVPELPDLPAVTWATLGLLTGVIVGLFVGSVLAVYDWQTPGAIRPLFFAVLGLFLGAVGLNVGNAALHQLFPPGRLAPSPAEVYGGRAELDGATKVFIALLCMTVLTLLAGGVLAVYDWQTPGAERPLFFGGLSLFLLAVVVKVVGAAVHHFGRR